MFVEKEMLKSKITEFISKGRLAFENGGVMFYGKSLEGVAKFRLCTLLLYSDKKEYIAAACEIIGMAELGMCHFTPMMLSKILLEYGDKINAASKTRIMEYLLSVKHELMGNELDFVGVNDNFPMMAAYAAMCMSKELRDCEMKLETERRLCQLESLLKRRGVISEYNSMTYTPLQLFVMASFAKSVSDKRLREIAINAQKRIWFDFIAHYHKETACFTGPYSRHYVLSWDPMKYFVQPLFDKCDFELERNNGKINNMIEGLYYLTEEYEADDFILDLYKNKKYPFEFKATSEYSPSTDATPEAAKRDMTKEDDFYEYAAGVSGLYTYQTEKYGIGTATNEWHNGVMTSSFSLEYRAETDKGKVTRNIWCRYLLNDEARERQPFFDQGRKMAFGIKNRAVVLYKPKIAAIPAVYSGLPAFLEEHYKKQEVTGNNGVTSAKLSVIIPLKGIDVEEIRTGNEKVTENCQRFEKAESVYIKDGGVFTAYHPLAVDDKGTKYGMEIRKRDDMLEISFYNYFGRKKDFAKRDFLHIRNGFLVSVNSDDEIPTFEEFIKKEKTVEITDRYISTNHSRQTYVRSVEIKTDENKLSCEYSPASEGIKHIACNDYPIEFPKLYASGVDIEKLPYIMK